MGHQMRSPFEFSYPCEPVSFDIDIVPPALPFCSVPVFTTPTVRITSLAFSAPVVIAPWNCHTIPTFFANVSATPTRDVSRFHVSMRVTPTSLDACDPEFSLSLLADIPCLPLSVAASAVVSMLPMGENVGEQWTPADPVVVAKASMKEHCDMQIDTAFKLPCIPFTPKVSSAIFVGSTPSRVPVNHDIKFAVDGCDLKLIVDMNLPEYPTPGGGGEVSDVIVIKSTVNVDYDVYADLALSACVDNDVIQLGVSLNLPCIPFTQELRGTPGTFYADACNLILSMPAGPWAVSFYGESATFTDCVFKRDSFTLNAATLTFAMPAGTENAVRYLGFEYNSQTHAVVIISGHSLSAVSESAMPETDIELIRTPLYKVIFSGDTWHVLLSYLALPSVGLYN